MLKRFLLIYNIMIEMYHTLEESCVDAQSSPHSPRQIEVITKH